jgi:hypothetical protein
MPRSFEILTEFPVSVEQVHAAFGSEDYWLARVAKGEGNVTLDSVTIDADDTVTVRTSQHLGRQILPAPVIKLIPGELSLLHSETWKPVGDREVRGHVNISASGGLGSGRAEAWLTPARDGSQLRYAVRVEVKIPLLGRKLEKSIGAGLAENLTLMQQFTATWIAENT